MISSENKPDPGSVPSPEREAIELQALNALNDALDGFEMESVGALYSQAARCIETEASRELLAEIRQTIMTVMHDFIESHEQGITNITSKDQFSIYLAQQGSQKMSELYDCFVKLSNWPDTFSPLLGQCRSVARMGFRELDRKILKFGEELRADFSAMASDFRSSVETLAALPAGEGTQAAAKELSRGLQEAFQASVDIEGVCAWRLTKSIRTIYRKIARSIREELGLAIELPVVPMDTTNTISAGNKIPRNW